MNKQKDASIPTIPAKARLSRWFGRNLIRIYAVFGFTYLFIPVLYTFAFSFNDAGKSNLIWKGFTLDNWKNPCGAPEVCTALGNSIKIGLLATIFSTILGTMIAFAIGRYAFKGRSSSNLLIFLPMATPEIVLGASLLSLFLVFHINPGFWPTVIAHVMFCISFVVVTVKARIASLDPRLEQAAMDLYANELETFRRVTLPLVAPGIAGAALLAFSLSFDDFIITNFNSGTLKTFPEFVYTSAARGIPANQTSISQTSAHLTPAAIRQALLRYSLAHSDSRVDLSRIKLSDSGDVSSPDKDELKTIAELADIASEHRLMVALGGDNSITYSAATAVAATGLITFDAHYDLRDGVSNGSPVRRLIESGLSGKNVVQIGIADFSNSPEYAARARELGITVIHRSELRGASLDQVWKRAVKVAGSRIHVDFDMDICDRSVVPACPAAAPGGISADEIRQFAFLAGASEEVVSVDITEIDAAKDSSDERTVRLAALVVLEVAAGLSTRI